MTRNSLQATSDKLMPVSVPRPPMLTIALVGAALLSVGVWALDLQARQARDTTRKLDLEDLEVALNRILAQTGTLPPENEPIWCGRINDQASRDVREAIERSLRETKKYAKAEKPFPADPRFSGSASDYAYWKTSPVSFELLAELEADPNNSRPLDLERCELTTDGSGPVPRRSPVGEAGYDYSIISAQRNPL